MGNVDFRPNLAGIRDALKQPGVQDELRRCADGIAADLNAGVDVETRSISALEPYGSAVNIHRSVAVGRVFTRNLAGRIDEARNHPIERYCD